MDLGIICHWYYFNFTTSGSTPVFTGDGDGGSGFAAVAAAAAASGGASGFEFGVDPNIDPELALALRVSMEEERARQEAAAKRAAEEAARQEKGEELSSKAEDATMTDHVNDSASEENKKTTDDMVSISLASFLSYVFVFNLPLRSIYTLSLCFLSIIIIRIESIAASISSAT